MDSARSDPPQPMQPTFGALLRRYRLAAGISQERLAERAGLSVQALSVLENGRRHAPYRHTVNLLARALELTADETAALAARTNAPTGCIGRGWRDSMRKEEQRPGSPR